jgi:hypothetical protein
MGFIFVFFKFCLYLIKDQVSKNYKEVDVYFNAFIISVLDTDELSLSRHGNINLLTTKRSLLYIRNQSVPHSKHFSPRL